MRIGLLYVVMAAVLVFAPIAYVSTSFLKTLDSEHWAGVNERTRQSLESRKKEILEQIGKPAGVLAQTSRFPWMKDFLDAYQKKSPDLEELGNTVAENLLAVYPDLGAPVRIAILDTTGKEIIALERVYLETRRVRQDRLLDRGGESWIDQVVGKLDSTYASEIYRLPSPDGLGRVPHVTVAQPLKLETDVVAIAWVEVNLKSLFDSMSKSIGNTKIYLVDDRQRYLIHPDKPSNAFAFETGRTVTLSDDFGNAAERMNDRFTVVWPQDRPERVLVGDTIQYVGLEGPRVELILSASVQEAVAGIVAQKKRFKTVLSASVVLFVVAALLISRRFVSTPVEEACRSVRMLREGKRFEEMPGSVLSATRGLSAELRLLSDELAARALAHEQNERSDG